MSSNSTPPPVRLRSEAQGVDRSFTETFRVGRDPACELQLHHTQVSRVHAQITPHEGSWEIQDLGSTNGLLLNGQKVEEAQLRTGDSVQFGQDGPVLAVELETAGHGGLQGASDSHLSLSEIEEKYLNPDSTQPAGDRTRMIRVAFDQVRKKQRRKSSLVLGVVLVLLVGTGAYAAYQRYRVQLLDRRAAEVFRTIKSYEVQLVGLRQLAESSGSPDLGAQVARIDSLRQEVLDDYDGYVQDRGLYRKLGSTEEALILRTARLFGESEFAVSGGFVQAVLQEIEGYWLSPAGRSRFQEAVDRAGRNGYIGPIVDALREQGVAPEFFYLALQESDFNADAVGPDTRWGRAKGMWQFIPTTAERYGLDPGALAETAQRDPADDRMDFTLASDAAARYLRDLHGILTQASGLLVMAAYNWGEHRVAPRLESLPTPRDVFQAEFAEVPSTPTARNYWTFLTEYEDRMPDQTKDYVLKIFAAAVIGQDPGHFGFDFGNPLEPYLN